MIHIRPTRHRTRGLASLLMTGFVALLTTSPVRAQSSTSQAAQESSKGCFPPAVQLLITSDYSPSTQTSTMEAAPCPCFGASDLTRIPEYSFDLCIDSALVEEVAGWEGPCTADGQLGFYLLVSLSSPRATGNKCLLLHRYPGLGGMQQIYRRPASLSDEEAAACHRLLADWVATRGGCPPPIVEP